MKGQAEETFEQFSSGSPLRNPTSNSLRSKKNSTLSIFSASSTCPDKKLKLR